jgi:hypothetical protein
MVPVVFREPAPAPVFPSVLALVAISVAAAGLLARKVPGVELHTQFGAPGPDSRINLADRCKGKKVILVGLPGAFTPT